MDAKKIIAVIIISLIVILSYYIWLTKPYVPYAMVQDIDILISPEKIIVKDFNDTITLKVDLKNIAQE